MGERLPGEVLAGRTICSRGWLNPKANKSPAGCALRLGPRWKWNTEIGLAATTTRPYTQMVLRKHTIPALRGGGGPPALGVNSTHTKKNGRKGERFSVLFLSLPTRGNPAPPPAQKSSSRLWNGRRRVVVTVRHCCHFLGARRLTNWRLLSFEIFWLFHFPHTTATSHPRKGQFKRIELTN